MKHHEKARLMRDEYFDLTSEEAPYPRSGKKINELRSKINDIKTNREFLRLSKILNENPA